MATHSIGATQLKGQSDTPSLVYLKVTVNCPFAHFGPLRAYRKNKMKDDLVSELSKHIAKSAEDITKMTNKEFKLHASKICWEIGFITRQVKKRLLRYNG